jgi:hypothetical protein
MAASIAFAPRPASAGLTAGIAGRREGERRIGRSRARAVPIQRPSLEAKAKTSARDETRLRDQAFTAFSIRVGSAGLAYLSQILFARLLGVDAYGVFAVTWTFVLVLGHIASCGLSESAVRFLPRYQLRGLTLAFGATGAACASALAATFRSALVIGLARIALAPKRCGAIG